MSLISCNESVRKGDDKEINVESKTDSLIEQYSRNGDTKAILQELNSLPEKNRKNAKYYKFKSKLEIEIGDYKNAIKSIGLSSKYEELSYENLFDIANCFFRIGDLDSAENAINSSIVLNPNWDKSHILAGEIYYKKENYEKLIRHYGIARKLSFNNTALSLKLIKSYQHLNKIDSACIELKFFMKQEAVISEEIKNLADELMCQD